MAVNIRINIPVDEGAFDRYYQKFNSYLSSLEDLPESWKSLKDEAHQMQQHLGQAAQALSLLADGTSRMVDDAGRLRDQSDKTSRHWGLLARNTLQVSKNIGEATVSLLKWVGITSLIGGLVGGGSLYGLDRLAAGVSSRRSQALGLGTTYGGLQAMQANLGPRLGDVEGILGRVNAAMLDPAQSSGLRYLLGGGAGADKIMTGDSANATVAALEGLGRIVDNMDRNTLIPQMEARKVTDVFSIEEIQRWKAMTQQQRSKVLEGVRADQKAFDVDAETQRRWTEFQTKLGEAARAIGKVFIEGLLPLEQPLVTLSQSIIKTVEAFGKSDTVKDWIEELSKGLEWLATNMDTPEFRDKMSNFVENLVKAAKYVAELGGSVLKVLGWFNTIFGITPAQGAAPAGSDAGRGMGNGPAGANITNQGSPDGQGGASERPTLGWGSGGGGGIGTNAGRGPTGAEGYTRGVRNMNPGNIGYGPFAISQGSTGAAGTDTGHGVAVFPSYESGYKAMDALLQKRYAQGRHSAEEIIAAEGGWTPGNREAAANVARSMGVDPNADVRLNDPAQRKRFEHGLMQQELGPKGAAYYDSQLEKKSTTVTIHKNAGANPATINNAMVPQQ